MIEDIRWMIRYRVCGTLKSVYEMCLNERSAQNRLRDILAADRVAIYVMYQTVEKERGGEG